MQRARQSLRLDDSGPGELSAPASLLLPFSTFPLPFFGLKCPFGMLPSVEEHEGSMCCLGACEDGEVRFDPPHGRRHAPCHQGASTPRVRRAHGSILPSRPTRRRLGDERRRGRDAIKRGGYVVTNCAQQHYTVCSTLCYTTSSVFWLCDTGCVMALCYVLLHSV